MGMHTHQCTQNYFQKYKCKILTPQVIPFRNLIAILYSLLPLRLIFVLHSKNTCLRLSTIFCNYTKPWSTEISSSSELFWWSLYNMLVIHQVFIYQKQKKRVSSIISFSLQRFHRVQITVLEWKLYVAYF